MAKAVGIIRRLDDLGRIVIPRDKKELKDRRRRASWDITSRK